MTYSPGLDGLRAIAVLAVVLFHLDIPYLSGGYVGVDVFFVLSGFLITHLLRARLREGAFSARDFYLKRIARLLPALMATVLGTTLVALVLLTPWDFRAFARSAVGALMSFSNIVFYFEAGYWDADSALKPLLHTWSLGVEEQFYLLWPLLLVALVRLRGDRYQVVALVVLMLSGALGTVLMTAVDLAAAFYLMPFRIFQFAAGAMLTYVAVLTSPGATSGIPGAGLYGAAGVALLLLSIACLDASQLAYPGIWALLPTIAAMLAVLAVTALRIRQPRLLLRLLESAPAVFFGRISYALYLVHWPLVSLYRYRFGAPGHLEAVGLFLLMVLLALLLHHGIERRFYQRAGGRQGRAPEPRSPPRPARVAAGAAGIIGLLGPLLTTAWLGDGWAWRRPDLRLDTAAIESGMQRRFRHLSEACRLKDMARGPCQAPYARRILVLGNSLEPDGYNFLRGAIGSEPGLQFVLFGTTNRCPRIARVDGRVVTSSRECQERLDRLYAPGFLRTIDAVLYAANRPYASNKAAMLLMLRELKSRKPGVRVATLGSYINTRRDCAFYINEYDSPAACIEPQHVAYFASRPEDLPLYRDFQSLEDLYIDRVDLLCRDRRLDACRFATDRGTPMMYDWVHFSLEFAEMTGRLYRERHGNRLQRALNLTAR